MRKDITISAEARSQRGKNEMNRLRASGKSPATLYGAGKDPVAVTVAPKELNRILASKTGHNTIFDLAVSGGETVPVMIVDWQLDPVKDTALHYDLKRIDMALPIVVKVPVHLKGESRGVKLQGGLMEVISREIEIRVLPNEIPEEFVVDVSGLGLNQSVRAGDIPLSESMELLSDEAMVITHIVALKAEAAATDAEGKAAEPEVIKKGKKEDAAAPAADAKKKK
jgi:large subunit ribosomal protein L25